MQARDVVLVVLDRVERDRERQIRQAGMDAILLIDRHLILFQVESAIRCCDTRTSKSWESWS